jgi:ArsR family transcriptional regulator
LERKVKKEKVEKRKANMADVSAAFKALSNETRLAIFECIRSGQCEANPDREKGPSVCAVANNFDMALSTISHHIKELRHAGLIRCQKRGQTIL